MQQRPSEATLQFKVLTSSSNRIYNTLQQPSRNYSLKIQSQSRLLSKKKVNELNGGIRKSSKKTCTVLRAQEVAEISCSSSFSAKSCSACYASCCIRSNVTATAAAFACCFASHSAASLPAVEADESSQ